MNKESDEENIKTSSSDSNIDTDPDTEPDSDPDEVFAIGDLEHYGKNGPFRGFNCRSCEFKNKCDYYLDITKYKLLMDLYVNNEKYDGYIRDKCLFREDIDIYDKMSAQIKYANNVSVNYSLTTYSPFEGWRIAFNGTEGRIEASLDIPYYKKETINQEELHVKEMDQNAVEEIYTEPIIVHKLWEKHDTITVEMEKEGHGGGDSRLLNKIFVTPDINDQFDRSAGIRDGLMSILIGIAARNSIESNKPVKIKDLIYKMIKLSGFTVKDEKNPDGDIEIKIIGLRPGEKLYEELLIDKKNKPTKHKDIFASIENIDFEKAKELLQEIEFYLKNSNQDLPENILSNKLINYKNNKIN